MKLNHLHLTVTDVQAAKHFLQTYFGLRGEGGSRNFDVLFDDDGIVLTLMKASRGTVVKYPGHFHIGFFVESEETVNAINRRLKEDGYDVPAPAMNNHAYGFYVNAPGGFTVDLGA